MKLNATKIMKFYCIVTQLKSFYFNEFLLRSYVIDINMYSFIKFYYSIIFLKRGNNKEAEEWNLRQFHDL